MSLDTTKIVQNDLFIDDKELEYIQKSIDQRWLSEGAFAKKFSEEISKITDSNYVTFAPNGTLGLFLALIALDLPKESEIILPSFTFYASATACIFAGLKPVFIDVDLDTCNLVTEKITSAITNNTSAIMAIHIYGQSCNIEHILEIAKEHNLKVIEDAAQGFGVRYKGRHVGSIGDVGVFSFFSDKVITTGEGAAIVTNNKSLFEKILLLRNQGRPSAGTFIHPELGMNFRITDIQAGIGLSQLNKFPQIIEDRLNKFALYEKTLCSIPSIQVLKIASYSNFIPFRFCFRTDKKEILCQRLNREGIATRSYFFPMHLQPKLKKYTSHSCRNSEILYEEGVCLPIHHHLSNNDIEFICEKISLLLKE